MLVFQRFNRFIILMRYMAALKYKNQKDLEGFFCHLVWVGYQRVIAEVEYQSFPMAQQIIEDICLCCLEFDELNYGNETLHSRHMTKSEGGDEVLCSSSDEHNQTEMVVLLV